MVSSEKSIRARKRPEERREEILSNAAQIALEEGLERITLRAVAERLGVRPGLITHYYPAAEDLVIEAFVRAAVREREQFFPPTGTPIERLAHFVRHIESGASASLARLWLNARHLSRFSPALTEALETQDSLDRARMTALLEEGRASGDFADVDLEAACIRIFLAVDGSGSYVNSPAVFTHSAHAHFLTDVTEWALKIEPGTLRAAVASG
jgi:AcrR family transcriptional regulator